MLAQIDLGVPGEHNAQQERQGPGRQQQAQKQMEDWQGLQQQRRHKAQSKSSPHRRKTASLLKIGAALKQTAATP